jgi:pimeloyl-ACP methyl ester carboxylesterase
VHAIRFEWAVRATIATLPYRSFQTGFFYWIFEDSLNHDEESQRAVDRLVEETFLARRWFKPKMMVNPTVLKDSEIRGIAVPMLFIVGENEKMYSAERAAERLVSLNPTIVTEIIPGAGHDVTILLPDQVNAIILDFFGQ